MIHKLTFEKGTNPRNHIVRCSCGWAYASTHHDVTEIGYEHQRKNNPLTWLDPKRKFQREESFDTP
jgi:hypothetical protein